MLRKGQGSDGKGFKVNTRVLRLQLSESVTDSDPRQIAVNYSCQDFGMNVTMRIYFHLLEIQSVVGEYDCDGL